MILIFPRLLTKSTRLTMTRNAVWALSNLCRGKSPPPDFEKVCTENLTLDNTVYQQMSTKAILKENDNIIVSMVYLICPRARK